MIRNISFDLWNTLVKSNPLYKPLRNGLIRRIFFNNVEEFGGDKDRINNWIKMVDAFCDYSNEVNGEQMSWRQAITLCAMGVTPLMDKDVFKIRLQQFEEENKKLFQLHPFEIYSEETVEVLAKLREQKVIMTIASNTSFVKGELLRKGLEKRKLSKYFAYQLYSDELGVSKPNSRFFTKICELNPVECANILHVGDNPYADGGALKHGMKFLHVNGGTETTISEVLNLIK